MQCLSIQAAREQCRTIQEGFKEENTQLKEENERYDQGTLGNWKFMLPFTGNSLVAKLDVRMGWPRTGV